MKINNEKVKSKVVIIVLGLVITGLASVIAISYLNHSQAKVAQKSNTETVQPTVIIEPVDHDKVDPALDVAAQQEAESPTTTEDPIIPGQSNTSIQDGQPQASIKPTEPPKPTPQGDNTDKTQQPTYTETDVKRSNNSPKMGDKNDKGEIYVDGFGWIKDVGGEGDYTIIDSEGDINKQVGIMD